jgi:hypothetical protein
MLPERMLRTLTAYHVCMSKAVQNSKHGCQGRMRGTCRLLENAEHTLHVLCRNHRAACRYQFPSVSQKHHQQLAVPVIRVQSKKELHLALLHRSFDDHIALVPCLNVQQQYG